MKKSFKFLLIFLVLGLVLTLSACKGTELTAPEITLDETVVSWEAILDASGYKVIVNYEEYETEDLFYDLKNISETSYEITVIALGNGKKILDSLPSNKITVTPVNKVELEGSSTATTLKYNLKVQSNADVLGFKFDISYPTDKLSITEADIIWNDVVLDEWVYDINIKDGIIKIAITGLEPINVRLFQTLCVIEFSIDDAPATAQLDAFLIDNG